MEEEKKEEIETLGNTAPIETITEETVPTETVTEPAAPVVPETAPEVEPSVVETPVVEVAPVVETATEVAVETAQEVAPTETTSAPVAEVAATEATPEVKPEEKPKKSKAGLIVIILLLLVLAGFAVWYFVLGGNGSKKEEPKNEPEQQNTKPEVKEDTIVNLTENDIKDYDTIFRYFIRIKDTKDVLETKDFSNQQILFSTHAINETTLAGKDFSAEDLKKAIQKLYGDVSYTDEDIKCTICGQTWYKYDETTKSYKYTPEVYGHGGEGGLRFEYYFDNGTRNETKGTMEINLKVVYGDYQGDISGPNLNLYLNAKDAREKKNGVNEEAKEDPNTGNINGYDKPEDYKAVYDEHKDEIPVTTFYFEKDSSGYYGLKKVETK